MKLLKLLTICFVLSCLFTGPLYGPCLPNFTIEKNCVSPGCGDPDRLEPGDWAEYEIIITNTSNCPWTTVDMNFIVDDPDADIEGMVVGPIAAGESVTIPIQIPVPDCPTDGCFPISNTVTATAYLEDGTLIAEKSASAECEYLCVTCGCRFTGGGVDTDGNWDHTLVNGEMIRNGSGKLPEGIDRAQFGGQAGANTALPPRPKGEWTHHQQIGPSGRFTFHGGTASAPVGSEIYDIRCSDPGTCKPSGDPPSPARQLDFDGIGTFKSLGKGKNASTFEISKEQGLTVSKGGRNRGFTGTFHWFEVNVDDLGEPGRLNTGAPDSAICPNEGFGEKGSVALGDCECPDFYRITIYNGVDAADVTWLDDDNIDPLCLPRGTDDIIYEFYGYIDGGNLQLHHLTGYDGDSPCP